MCLAVSSKSELLKCSFTSDGQCFDVVKEKYEKCFTCEFAYTQLSNIKEAIEIDRKNNGTVVDVKKVQITGGVLNFIPEKIFQVFPKLSHLGVKSTTAESLGVDFFKGADELQVFEYQLNNVKIVNANAFEYASNLKTIALDGNNIEKIDSNAFRKLARLKSLVLSRNKLFKIDPLWFQDMQNLFKLEMIQCNIQNIDDRSFGFLTSLKRLYMNKNEITKLEKHAFKKNLQLEYIDFAGNKIKEIPGRLFSNLNNLNYLNLALNECINSEYVKTWPSELELEPCDPGKLIFKYVRTLYYQRSNLYLI